MEDLKYGKVRVSFMVLHDLVMTIDLLVASNPSQDYYEQQCRF
jgi:hypothetical protein